MPHAPAADFIIPLSTGTVWYFFASDTISCLLIFIDDFSAKFAWATSEYTHFIRAEVLYFSLPVYAISRIEKEKIYSLLSVTTRIDCEAEAELPAPYHSQPRLSIHTIMRDRRMASQDAFLYLFSFISPYIDIFQRLHSPGAVSISPFSAGWRWYRLWFIVAGLQRMALFYDFAIGTLP